jgi:hypothetical protein
MGAYGTHSIRQLRPPQQGEKYSLRRLSKPAKVARGPYTDIDQNDYAGPERLRFPGGSLHEL